MSARNFHENEMSYELYREIADELCVPVDDRLGPEVRFELYSSKLVYLRHLREHCFRAVNHGRGETAFSPSDLELIGRAFELTNRFLADAVRQALRESFARVGRGAA
jgi:hypothetical protein